MRPLRSPAALLVALCLGLSGFCAACDEAIMAPPISASCAQIGSQCQLPGGPLGVCQQIDCSPGSAPPCFKCVSQH